MASKTAATNGTRPARKAAQTNGTRRASTARKPATKPSGRREGWKKVFERYLVKEGYSPAEAKELVEISAA
jgi:hypothetical protein